MPDPGAAGPRHLEPLGHIARRKQRRRMTALAVGVAAVCIGAVLAWPAATSDPIDLPADDDPILGTSKHRGPLAPPDKIVADKIDKDFAVVSAVRLDEGVLVTGTCSPAAVARVLVADRHATLAPSAATFRILLRGDVPAEITVVAHGATGDTTEVTVPVIEPEAAAEGAAVRLLSHADGATVHSAKTRIRVEPVTGGDSEQHELVLTDVDNLIAVQKSRFVLYLAPEGLTYVRTTDKGHQAFLRRIDGQEMILVPAGVASRGMGKQQPHGPKHLVRMSAYLIDRTEVTRRQYARFMHFMRRASDLALRHPEDPGVELRPTGWTSNEPPAGTADLPATGVSWFAAWAYARWAGGRLPTEAEWERAAAGPEGRAYPWGDEFDVGRCRVGVAGPIAADSMASGESLYSLLHMSGNAREWCEDRFDPRWYMRGARTNPRGPTSNQHRVVRGGSWSTPTDNLRLQFRDHLAATDKPADVGFRVVRRWVNITSD